MIIKLLIMKFSPLPCHLVPLRPKYSPQHPILKHPQPTFFPQCQRSRLTPIHNNKHNYSSVYLNLYIFGKQTMRQNILYRMTARTAWLQSPLHFFLLVCIPHLDGNILVLRALLDMIISQHSSLVLTDRYAKAVYILHVNRACSFSLYSTVRPTFICFQSDWLK
jgi:hypothetical protein